MKTKEEIKMNFRGYEITIPKGTKTTNKTACGIDEKYNFVDDLTWIPANMGMLRHDATYYGINIDKNLLKN